MNFQEFVSFQLNGQSNFCQTTAEHFEQPFLNIERAVQLIIENTLLALTFQCSQNNKTEEIYKIARDCGGVSYNKIFTAEYENTLSKGRGIVAEIFGVQLVNMIDNIAIRSNTKYQIINNLTCLITPVALATINHINIQNNYTPQNMGVYLANQASKVKNAGQVLYNKATRHSVNSDVKFFMPAGLKKLL